MCTGKVLEKQGKTFTPEIGEQIVNDFCEFTKEKPVEFLKYTGEFRYCTLDQINTLVAMCKISNLDNFIDLINKRYDYIFDYQPAHVTLYTKDRGIWLVDADDLEKLTKIVPAPEGVSL